MSDPSHSHHAGPSGQAEPKGQESTRPFNNGLVAAERRCLTVMMLELAEQARPVSDPEELSALLEAFQSSCAAAVERLGGTMVDGVGDAVTACFGWPAANENEAERAIHCARLIICDSGRPVPVRVGIASGLVLAREVMIGGGACRSELVGTAPNLASRLKDHADPDGIVVCALTASLAGRTFVLRDIGPLAIKGLPVMRSAFAVLGEGPAVSRFEARTGSGAEHAPLVGRDAELARLRDAWQATLDGDGGVIVVGGEGGVGKSRLVQGFLDELSPGTHLRMIFQCSPFHRDTPLHPVIAGLRQAWGLGSGTPDAVAVDRLEARLADFDLATPENLALVAMLFDLDPAAAAYRPLADSPLSIRRRMLRLMLDYLLRMAGRKPVLVILEDAHWIDPSTRQLLEMAQAAISSRRILIVVTGRSPVIEDLPGSTARLDLGPLAREAARTLIRQLTAGRRFVKPLVDAIAERTDGIPLFAEEMTRALLEVEGAGTSNLDEVIDAARVPISLSDVLNARVDRSAGDRMIVQAAACIGREFSADLLAFVLGRPPQNLASCLEELVRTGLIEPAGEPGSGRYTFRHFLIQQAAYGRLLNSDRRTFHSRVAVALSAEEPGLRERQPEELARHLLAADRPCDALPLYEAAGTRAAARSANLEAVSHLRRALGLVSHLGDEHQRRLTELGLLMKLGPALMALRGYADQTVEATYQQALALLEHLAGHETENVTALFGLWTYYVVRNRQREALEIGERLHAIAEALESEDLLLEAHVLLAVTHFARGTVVCSRQHSETALRLYDPQRHRGHAMLYGQEPGMAATTFLAIAFWWLGEEAEALHHARRALRLAEASDHPFSIAFCLCILGRLHMLRDDAEAAAPLAERAAALADEQLFPIWGATAAIVAGWSQARLASDPWEGLARMRAGIEAYSEIGAQLSLPLYQAILLDLEGDRVDPEEARQRIAAIEAAATDSEGLGDYVEILRIRAGVLRRCGDRAGAAHVLRTALVHADATCARAWAARAARDLEAMREKSECAEADARASA